MLKLLRLVACTLLLCTSSALLPIHAEEPAAAPVVVTVDEPATATTGEQTGPKQEKVDILRQGMFHWEMIPLWIISFILLAVIFERANALRSKKVIDAVMIERVVELMQEADLDVALAEAKKSPTVIGQAWAQALHEFSLGGVALEEVLTSATTRALRPLKRNLPTLATLATISPLFGLFATVLGIMISFGQMGAEGGADKAELARAIGIALFGTAGGILMAIPAIVTGRFFLSKINGFAERCEAAIDQIRYGYTRAVAELDGKKS